VAARTSCFAFKGRREDLRAVGEKLDVATVLEGSVRRSGARLRITVQMVKVADGYQMWSERYDREMTDVFAVQDEIAAAVAARLKVALHGPAARGGGRRGTASLEAYELFLRGRALQYRRGGSILDAARLFEQAIAIDPAYAEAHAWLADSYRLLGTYGMAPALEVMPRARAAAEKALALDPDDCEALATLADVAIQFDHDPARAMALWARSIAIDPRHVRTLCERALWQSGAGLMDPGQGVLETHKAMTADPLNAWAAGMHAFMLGIAQRHAEAIVEAQKAVAIDPGSWFARYTVMQANAWAGNDDVAFALGPPLLAASGRHVWALGLMAWLSARQGDADRARAIHDELSARARHEYVGPMSIALAAAAAGRAEEALRLVDRAITERDPLLGVFGHMAHFDDLRAIPGVEARIKELRP
jgi:serine/threonine-protein kinase